MVNSTAVGPLKSPEDGQLQTQYSLAIYRLRTEINGVRTEFSFDICGNVTNFIFHDPLPAIEKLDIDF